jgi:hypothetical protein
LDGLGGQVCVACFLIRVSGMVSIRNSQHCSSNLLFDHVYLGA